MRNFLINSQTNKKNKKWKEGKTGKEGKERNELLGNRKETTPGGGFKGIQTAYL